MTKITYLLGAGASYYACPILEEQAEKMIEIANKEISRLAIMQISDGVWKNYDFIDKSHLSISNKNEYKILWWMGHFGEMAKEYNTIDTYARKLFLNGEENELNLLKMSVSIFFDLWENFYFESYSRKIKDENLKFNKIDNRYKSLFSILLDKDNNGKIKLNNDFKFISWNYDLQLEETFKMFLKNNDINCSDVDNQFKFKEDNKEVNDVFHLNGHRGFYNITEGVSENRFNTLDNYWINNENLHQAVIDKSTDFNGHIKYAWEHNLDDNLEDSFLKKISEVMHQTDVLIIIGYSFPAFNRNIDQFLFNKMHPNKIKKIIYQDPNATIQMIANLFEKPENYKGKIEVISDLKELKQFYLPNEHFISQKNGKTKNDLR